ncbi:MAG: GGDEF domain-containing protein [Paracoccus sp.]|uniref:GGDEF domain-containing protein n=1 Tax=Paracoccus sp. TaxID=267 RepID=UPI000C57DA13|nr:GGDEF domain-containing protein [Paracoccus sp. (in: a-proteobacteria)]MBA50265.1 GGDEF domain-containing protein [Paracoccus sp. (in: a-proteobacteria)]
MRIPEPQISFSTPTLQRLLPMHLLMAPDGEILGTGPTLRKVLGRKCRKIGEVLTQARATTGQSLIDEIATAATRGERLFLRLTEPPHLTLRGHAVAAAGSETAILINLGFGIGLTDAVSHAGLTDQDFAPAELAMELLFLHEANRAALSELSNFNQQLQAAREAAELQAHTDPLTGLTNRRGVELVLSAALKTFRDGKGAGFALAQLDLDRFKDVNDRLGHAAGDRVLCDVADILKEAIRSNDTAARVGGDEFLLILRDLNDAATLDRLACRIIRRIEERIPEKLPGCTVSASVGIVLSEHYRNLTEDRILHDADVALYRSKYGGRGRGTILSEVLPVEPALPAGTVAQDDADRLDRTDDDGISHRA